MKKFSRKILADDPILPYNIKDNTNDITVETLYTAFNNCHWGQLKLFYSEMEFLVLCSKYVDITKCLIVYVGAATGYRLKYLFLKLFPNTKYLLYDPNPFEIENDENFIIKTGDDGWFNDDKIKEVLDIAAGRKILYLSDIRITDDNSYEKELLVHNNLQEQQRWGILMNADFMLLKFRGFFYQKDPSEIDFIDNNATNQYKKKIIFNYDAKKHESKQQYFLYLDGDIYTQIYAGKRSSETRLFVKKLESGQYKMRYYDNIQYEGLLNYFNLKVRSEPYTYKDSDILAKYIPGTDITYTLASEYYIIYKYLEFYGLELSYKNVLKKLIYIYIFLNVHYTNNLIICVGKNIQKNSRKIGQDLIKEYYEKMQKIYTKQFKNIRNCDFLSEKQKENFINSYNCSYKDLYIKNGRVYLRNK
jgi:hypothetical protein